MPRTKNIIEIRRTLASADRLQTGEVLPSGREHDSRAPALANALAKNEELLDSLQATYFCQLCRTAASPMNLYVVLTNYGFSTFYELIAQTLELLQNQFGKPASLCSECKSPLQRWIDRHHLDRNLNRDLVIRVSKNTDSGRLTYQLICMDSEGNYSEVTSQQIPQLEDVPFENFERAAIQAIDQGALDKAARLAKDALYMFPGHKGLLRIAIKLAHTPKRGIAEAMAEAHNIHHPSEADGYALLAFVFMKSFLAGNGKQPSLLAEALSNAETALKLNPNMAEAGLVMSDCLRLQGAPDHVITASYKDLLRKYPTYVPALYNYGLHCLSVRPKEALSCFDKGSAIAPSDIDFLIGKAKAFLQMQLPREAQQALARAKRIVPMNAHIVQLMAQIDISPAHRPQ